MLSRYPGAATILATSFNLLSLVCFSHKFYFLLCFVFYGGHVRISFFSFDFKYFLYPSTSTLGFWSFVFLVSNDWNHMQSEFLLFLPLRQFTLNSARRCENGSFCFTDLVCLSMVAIVAYFLFCRLVTSSIYQYQQIVVRSSSFPSFPK